MVTVSVIIPYYNQGKYLHAAVQSSLAAFSGDVEIIVVDDGSTESHANHYCTQATNLDSRVRVIRKQNGGLSSARNAGLNAANGEYIQFLDCDDVLLPGKLDQQVSQLVSSKGKLVSVSGYYVSNEGFRDLRDESQTISRFPLTLNSFLFYWERGFSVPIHAGLFCRSVFENISFNEELHGKEDWVFWSTLAGEMRGAMIYCPIVGAVYRLHGNGMTRSLDKMGEAWAKATRLLSERYGSEFPEFEGASNDWHRKFYKSGRLQTIALRSPKKSTYSTALERKSTEVPSATLLHSRAFCETERPVISFVIPVYNHSKYLKQCVESVVKQTPSASYEIVVVDDRSTEADVINVLKSIETHDTPYRVFQNDHNYGISITQNLAVQQCRGEYVAFLDCDDYLEPFVVDEVTKVITVEDAPDYIFTDRNHIDEHGSFISRVNYGGYDWIKPSGSVENDLLLGMVASHLKIIRKDLYQNIGGSNVSFSGVQDWELALRVIGKGRFHYLDKALYNHRLHGTSVSNSGSITQFWMTNVLRRKHLEDFCASELSDIEIEIAEFSLNDIPMLSKLFKESVRFTYRCDLVSLPDQQINMLREFNSYFDKLYIPLADTSSLMGYLWDHRLIHPL